jgi:hypothetical protein
MHYSAGSFVGNVLEQSSTPAKGTPTKVRHKPQTGSWSVLVAVAEWRLFVELSVLGAMSV